MNDTVLKVDFSEKDEEERIKYTLKKLDWFREQKYQINFPNEITKIVELGRVPTDKEIRKAVSGEFEKSAYKEKEEKLLNGWQEVKESFLEKLMTLGLSVQKEYEITFTKYGVGGSYGLPNNIQINIDYPNARDVLSTTLHEIIHLTIGSLIKEHKIDHWTKERIVDLIYGEFFPEKRKLQRDPENTERLGKIFKQYFPDMDKIIKTVSEMQE